MKGGGVKSYNHKIGHFWDLKIKNSVDFKMGRDRLVKRFKREFDGRMVIFGTYDFNMPNDAIHWLMVPGKSNEDHIIPSDELQK